VIKHGFGDWLNGFKKNRVIPSIADQSALERLGYARPPQDAEDRSKPSHAVQQQ